MGCGVSQFKREETELSNDDVDKHADRRSASSQVNYNVDNNSEPEKGSKDRSESEDDHLFEIDQRQDLLKYPGSPSFRFYCDPKGHQIWQSPSRTRSILGNNVDHVPKKNSNMKGDSDECLLDLDKESGGDSSIAVRKESRVKRFKGAIFFRSSKQKKSLRQKTQS